MHLHVCRNTIRNALQRLTLRWRRPRLAMPRKTDPAKARKQWEIAEAVISAGPDAVVMYADESRLQTLPLWYLLRGRDLRGGGAFVRQLQVSPLSFVTSYPDFWEQQA